MPPSNPSNNISNSNKFTWKQVAEHNTEKSAWVYMGKKVYDITPWLEKHPGGKQVLLLAAGRDVTDLLASYHPFTDKPQNIIQKYEIGEITTTEFPQYKPDTGFYRELRKEVADYFTRTGKDPKDPLPGIIGTVCLLSGLFSAYFIAFGYKYSQYLLLNWMNFAIQFPLIIKFFAAIFFGVFQALPLLHVMHDSSHTAFGWNEKWWLSMGKFTMDWVSGASLNSWHYQHVLGHHVYTNVVGADPDLPSKIEGDIRRVTRFQRWFSVYRFQHIYLLFLYGFLAIKFRIQDITDTVLSGTNGSIRINSNGHYEMYYQFVIKCCFIVWRVIIPLRYFQVPLLEFLLLFFVCEMTTGYYLTFNFQVSHVSPSTIFPNIVTGFDDEWAIAQVKTSVDYAHGSKLTTFLTGALNYQTVHHLFPCISQYHYPAIAPIVMRVCSKYNVPFTRLSSFSEAFRLHLKHLFDMGHNKHHSS